MQIDQACWALICMNDAVCHYVDPDDLEVSMTSDLEDA